jgi:hypothetical protein
VSIDALNWAFNINLPSSGQKLVLLTLANYADDRGEAYPSQKELARKTCLSERAIRDNLVRLEELEVIKRIPRVRQDGSYTTDLFQLNVGLVIKIDPVDNSSQPAADSAGTTGSFCQTQRQILPNPAADSAGHEPSLNTTITKSNHQSARDVLIGLGITPEVAGDWVELRKKLKAPITGTVLKEFQLEAEKAGYTLEQVFRTCCKNGWRGFEAGWVKDRGGGSVQTSGPPWWSSDSLILAKGSELGLSARPGESMGEFKGRINAKISLSTGNGEAQSAAG